MAKGRRIGIGLLAILGASPVAMAADGEVELRATLRGFEEVPAVSTTASGTFRGDIDRDELSIGYTLSYSGLEGTVTQAHIHLGQRRVAGGIATATLVSLGWGRLSRGRMRSSGSIWQRENLSGSLVGRTKLTGQGRPGRDAHRRR